MSFFLNPLKKDKSLSTSFSDLFDDFFNEKLDVIQAPAINLSETKDTYEIEAELPGLSKDDFKVNLSDDVLTVSGEKKEKKESKDKEYHLTESRYGSFSRSIRLPGKVDDKKVNATYKDGVLKIVLDKAEEEKQKSIDIKVD